ncbi:MAG TPA: hypothetical protein VGT82_12330 [Ktedonobacteraceae bacterium]|nr:hypothetical protein [Ktedonobacteraceae bacterium]
MQQNENQLTPQQQAQNVAHLVQQAQEACQTNIQQVNDAQAKVIFEGVSEILNRAIKVLNEYSSGKEHTLFVSSHEKNLQTEETGTTPPTVTEFAVDVDSSEPPPRLHTELTQE